MKFFTREWCDGSDAEHENREAMYQDHVSTIASRLTPSLLKIVRELSLHDALIRYVVVSPAQRTIKLALRAGDLQHGYYDADLEYHEVDLAASRLTDLPQLVSDPEAELLYDEVDVNGSAYTHRCLWWPAGEISIVFGFLVLTVAPQEGRNFIARAKLITK